MSEHALIPRATVSEICGHRRKAVELYEAAHSALVAAQAAVDDARLSAEQACQGDTSSYLYHTRREDLSALHGIQFPPLDQYLSNAVKMIDRGIWSRIMQMSDLERLMDKKAKDKLRQSLMEDPPEATEDNIRATMENMMGNAGLMFRRGIAECFSNLDRRFKSHNSFKIGSRVILSNVISEWGGWSYHRNGQDTIMDIERVFMILDGGEAPASHTSLAAEVDRRRPPGLRRYTGRIETPYFKVDCFKNGNVHLWFKRHDLLRKVNQLLGEYYGAPIPEERGPDADNGFHKPKTDVVKNFSYYPTPDDAAERVMEAVNTYRREGEPVLRVLEPSAGGGNLARRLVEKGCSVTCVEYQPHLAAELRAAGIYEKVHNFDFLAWKPDPDNLFDYVVMNPPFDGERDIDHVLHALTFLKPDGVLVAVMGAGVEYRETKKAVSFRGLIELMNGKFRDLPAGSFASVGTYMNTVILKVHKNGDRSYW